MGVDHRWFDLRWFDLRSFSLPHSVLATALTRPVREITRV
jgi:hypothetical protein